MKLRKSFFRKNIMVSSSELEKLRSENQNAYHYEFSSVGIGAISKYSRDKTLTSSKELSNQTNYGSSRLTSLGGTGYSWRG